MASRRSCFAFVIFLLGLASVFGQVEQLDGLNGLPPVEFSQLSDRDTNPLAAKALAIHPQDWKHAETAHFIYHFQRGFVASAVSVEAEFHFRVVTRELGKDDLAWSQKAHLYIFEQAADWESFRSAGNLEPWTGGIQSGGSLFIVRNPAYKFSDNSLGHEVAHLVLHRFYSAKIPRWLDEGFAQYASKGAQASFRRARGYLAKPSSSSIQEVNLFPLRMLTTMDYPPAAQVDTFYDESERLVRFLAATDRQAFLEVLELSAKGEDFASVLLEIAGGPFGNLADLEEKFRTYATKDAVVSKDER